MRVRLGLLIAAFLVSGCGMFESKKNDNKDEASEGDPNPAPTDEVTDQRKVATEAASTQMNLGLSEVGLAKEKIDAIVAAAQAKVDALPADATPAEYLMAFAQGAAEAMNEALADDPNVKTYDAASKVAGAVMDAMMARIHQNVLITAEDAAKLEKAIFEGSLAGMFQIELLGNLKTKLEGGSGLWLSSNISGIGSITAANISSLNLEAAMMMIQSQRAELLEGQLKTQLDSIQSRNKDIAALNSTLGKLKAERGLSFSAGLRSEVAAAGCSLQLYNEQLSKEQKAAAFDTWSEQIKGKIDSLNSAQQMDMLRMQSLTNKRNEAFDIMTNFIKKMADSRNSIIGNMRLTDDPNDPVLKTGRAFDARMFTTIAASFVRATNDATFAKDSMLKLMGAIATNIGTTDAANRLAEGLELSGTIIGREIAAMDIKSTEALFQSLADGSFAGTIASFKDHELAVKLMTNVAVGVVKGIGKHKDSSKLHAKVAAGYMSAFMVIAGKTPGTSENQHAGNDKVRMAFGTFLTSIKSELESQPNVFDVYKTVVEAEVEKANGDVKEILYYALSQVSPP